MYQELKNLAEKLGVQVSEQNFRPTGIRVRSGYCKVKGQDCCIIDKHLRLPKKVEALADCLSELPHEAVYLIPAVREYLEAFSVSKKKIPIPDEVPGTAGSREKRES
jgi:hypothetical protein